MDNHARMIPIATASTLPPIGLCFGKRISADAAVVFTVTLDVPLVADEDSVTELPGMHVGMSTSPDFEPATEQLSVTVPEKPLLEDTVIVEVADPPGETLDGEAAAALTLNEAVDVEFQLFTRFVTFTVPIPVAKSQPVPDP
jgi:hypothetical protein